VSAALRPLAWTTAAFLAGVLLHVGRMPLWATLTACACAVWSLAGRAGRAPLPGKVLRAAMAVALIAAVAAMFRTLNGLDAGTTLLAAMGAVKLLEARSRRDQYVVIGAALFLLLAAALSEQGLPYLPLYAAHVWICCTALAGVARPRTTSAGPVSWLGSAGASLPGGRIQAPGARTARLDDIAAAKLAARSLLLALPLAVLAFLFFPRLSGSLWALPDPGGAVTGLSDTLTPGAISDLSESSTPAFRVWFDGAPPPPAERYWRGPVLHDFDGDTWTRPGPWWFGAPRPPTPLGRAYRYRITLEPSAGRWWLALDTVDASPRRSVRLTSDHVLVSARRLTEPVTYDAVSHTRVSDADPLPARVRRRDLRLPPDRNPRALALARRLRERSASDSAFVAAALQFLRDGGFRYSLTPPRLGRDSVDDFLFGTRQGFCGHYASAFATLMRAGGVPARVVTGYLGGEWNPIGGYLLVRQSDAHAWVEVWLGGRGWTRVDPTAVVAPERLSRGIRDFLPGAASAPERLMLDVHWLASIRQAWDAANAWWTNEVIDFDLSDQLALLSRLGVRSPGLAALASALAIALVAWRAAMARHLGRLPRPPRPDRLARAYSRLCRKIERAGMPREPHEGPLAYAESIARHRPDLAAAARPLLERYAQLRFGGAPGGTAVPRAPYARRIAAFERVVARWRAP
jgi:transglutaminase-like putative cysteine protease